MNCSKKKSKEAAAREFHVDAEQIRVWLGPEGRVPCWPCMVGPFTNAATLINAGPILRPVSFRGWIRSVVKKI